MTPTTTDAATSSTAAADAGATSATLLQPKRHEDMMCNGCRHTAHVVIMYPISALLCSDAQWLQHACAERAGIAPGAASIAPTWSLLEAAACGRCLLQSHIDSWLDTQPVQLPHDSSCCEETPGAMKDVRGTTAAGGVDPRCC
jgi:hypothetical protein